MFRVVLISGIILLTGLLVWLVLLPSETPEGSIETIIEEPSGEETQVVTVVPYIEPDEEVEIERLPVTGLVTDLLKEERIASFQGVLDQIYLDVFLQHKCSVDGEPESSLMLTARYFQDPVRNHIDFAIEEVTKWEKDMIKDVGHLISVEVPASAAVNYIKTENVQGTDFKKVVYEVNGKTERIYYGWLLNYIFISGSARCLVAAEDEVYAPTKH